MNNFSRGKSLIAELGKDWCPRNLISIFQYVWFPWNFHGLLLEDTNYPVGTRYTFRRSGHLVNAH